MTIPRHARCTLGVGLLALGLTGCGAVSNIESPSFDEAAATSTPSAPAIHSAIIGMSVEGRPIEAITLRDGNARCTALFLATIHGDEPAGTPLVMRLARELTAQPELIAASRIVIVPVANPDGLIRHRRTNIRGVDLNRNFAASNHGTARRGGSTGLSEPEAEAIAQLIVSERPRVIVSLHQPLNCVDYDGPGAELAERIAQSTGLPVRKLGARPGSLGSFAGEDHGIPTITLELPRGATRWSDAELWDRYGHALLIAIRYGQDLAAEDGGVRGASGR